MLTKSQVANQDILKVKVARSPFAEANDHVRVIGITSQGVLVENKSGAHAIFLYQSNSDRLEQTEYKGNWPS